MTWMWPVRIYQDRYGGSYSGGGWVAVDMACKNMEITQIETGILGGDVEVREFWSVVSHEKWIAVGPTPNDALAALEAKQGVKVDPHPSAIVLTSKLSPKST
jgi:hypothetical protein